MPSTGSVKPIPAPLGCDIGHWDGRHQRTCPNWREPGPEEGPITDANGDELEHGAPDDIDAPLGIPYEPTRDAQPARHPAFDHDGTYRHHHDVDTGNPVWWGACDRFGGEKREHRHDAQSAEDRLRTALLRAVNDVDFPNLTRGGPGGLTDWPLRRYRAAIFTAIHRGVDEWLATPVPDSGSVDD